MALGRTGPAGQTVPRRVSPMIAFFLFDRFSLHSLGGVGMMRRVSSSDVND